MLTRDLLVVTVWFPLTDFNSFLTVTVRNDNIA